MSNPSILSTKPRLSTGGVAAWPYVPYPPENRWTRLAPQWYDAVPRR